MYLVLRTMKLEHNLMHMVIYVFVNVKHLECIKSIAVINIMGHKIQATNANKCVAAVACRIVSR